MKSAFVLAACRHAHTHTHTHKHTHTCTPVQVVKKAKLTKLVFNPKWPIILVGDDKGLVTCLKLSPNLRKQAQPKPGQKVREPGCSGRG